MFKFQLNTGKFVSLSLILLATLTPSSLLAQSSAPVTSEGGAVQPTSGYTPAPAPTTQAPQRPATQGAAQAAAPEAAAPETTPPTPTPRGGRKTRSGGGRQGTPLLNPTAIAGGIVQLIRGQTGFFLGFGLGGSYLIPKDRNSFCHVKFKNCVIAPGKSFEFSGEIELGYRFFDSFSLVGRADISTAYPKLKAGARRNADGGSVDQVELLTFYTADLGVRFFPLFLSPATAMNTFRHFYVEGGGGYSFVSYGNPVHSQRYQLNQMHLFGALGAEFQLTSHFYIGGRLGAGLFFSEADFYEFSLRATGTYYF